MTDLRDLELARQTLTEKEYEAFELWNRGAGYNRVADQLGISFSTARDRIRRALRKLANHIDHEEPNA